MISLIHKTTRWILKIITWPIMIGALAYLGFVWSQNDWKLNFNSDNLMKDAIQPVIFCVGCAIFGLNFISVFIRPLRNISNVIFSMASFATLGFIAFYCGTFLSQNNWQMSYDPIDVKNIFSPKSVIWSGTFVAAVSLMGIYLFTGFIWVLGIGSKRKARKE